MTLLEILTSIRDNHVCTTCPNKHNNYIICTGCENLSSDVRNKKYITIKNMKQRKSLLR